MWTYPAYPYLEFALISLAIGIAFSVIIGGIAYVVRPKAGVEG